MQLSYTQHWFIENKHFGTSSIAGTHRPHGHGFAAPCSQAYFCPACGDVWARVVVEDSQSPTGNTRFELNQVLCRKHSDAKLLSLSPEAGGTLAKPWWRSEFNQSIPHAVLTWELLHLADSYIAEFSPTKETV